jgi:hypothetical protein
MILESLDQIKEGYNHKSIHIIKLQENMEVLFGRSNECNIIIDDISVSRKHAWIKYEKGRVYLKDNKSTFGTLLLLRRDIQIIKRNLYLQAGRTFLEIILKDFKDNYEEESMKANLSTPLYGLTNEVPSSSFIDIEHHNQESLQETYGMYGQQCDFDEKLDENMDLPNDYQNEDVLCYRQQDDLDDY